MPLNLIDWICIAVIALSLLLGLWRGVIYEVFALMGWVAAYFVAQMFAQSLSLELPKFLPLQDWGQPVHYALAFVLVFIATLIGSSLLAWLLKKATTAIGLKPVDRALGGAFGLLRAGLILLVLTAVILMTPFAKDVRWQSAQARVHLITALASVKPLLPAKIQAYITEPKQRIE